MKASTKQRLAREYLSFLLWFGIPALATLILLAVFGAAPWWSPLAFGAAGYAWNKFYRFNVWVYQTLRFPPAESERLQLEAELDSTLLCTACGQFVRSVNIVQLETSRGRIHGQICPACEAKQAEERRNRRRCAGQTIK